MLPYNWCLYLATYLNVLFWTGSGLLQPWKESGLAHLQPVRPASWQASLTRSDSPPPSVCSRWWCRKVQREQLMMQAAHQGVGKSGSVRSNPGLGWYLTSFYTLYRDLSSQTVCVFFHAQQTTVVNCFVFILRLRRSAQRVHICLLVLPSTFNQHGLNVWIC